MENNPEKSGFTIIEVMLVLGLTGLLLVGLLGGTFSSIATQRYNDSVRSFAEYLRTVYGEVLSPESLGDGTSGSQAVYGKILVFGADANTSEVYSATLVGNATIPTTSEIDFIHELASVSPGLFCGKDDKPSTVANYTPLWGAEFAKTGNERPLDKFTGTVIIARAPSNGSVHTIYTDHIYNIKGDGCSSASNDIKSDFEKIKEESAVGSDTKFKITAVGICVESENSSRYREVRIAEDGRNTSAIWTLNTDTDDNGDRSHCGN